MAEIEKVVFEYREIVEALVKKQDIHEGIWALYIEFGISAANVAMRLGDAFGDEEPTQVSPSAIIPVQKIGIVKTDKESNITVDAAKVNPRYEHITIPSKKSKK
jgi:hypothetical protein